MLLNILMRYVFVGTCYQLSIVFSWETLKTGLFSFYGWQDHLNFSSEQRTVIYGASDFEATPLFCAFNCAQNKTCIMFYICRYLSNLNMFILKVITKGIFKRSWMWIICNLKDTFANSSHKATRKLYSMSAKQIFEIYQPTM